MASISDLPAPQKQRKVEASNTDLMRRYRCPSSKHKSEQNEIVPSEEANGMAFEPEQLIALKDMQTTPQQIKYNERFKRTISHNLRRIENGVSPLRKTMKTVEKSQTRNENDPAPEDVTTPCTSNAIKRVGSNSPFTEHEEKNHEENICENCRAIMQQATQVTPPDTASSTNAKNKSQSPAVSARTNSRESMQPNTTEHARRTTVYQDYGLVRSADGTFRYRKVYFVSRSSPLSSHVRNQPSSQRTEHENLTKSSPSKIPSNTSRVGNARRAGDFNNQDTLDQIQKVIYVSPKTANAVALIQSQSVNTAIRPSRKSSETFLQEPKCIANVRPSRFVYFAKTSNLATQKDTSSHPSLRPCVQTNSRQSCIGSTPMFQQRTSYPTPIGATKTSLLRNRYQPQPIVQQQPKAISSLRRRLSVRFQSVIRRGSRRDETGSLNSVTTSIINSMFCWRCFDPDADDDALNSLDSESGSDDNDDGGDGGGDDNSLIDDFDHQEDIDDIDYSSGGGGSQGSDASQAGDENSLYQDDIINNETMHGLYNEECHEEMAFKDLLMSENMEFDDDFSTTDEEERRDRYGYSEAYVDSVDYCYDYGRESCRTTSSAEYDAYGLM